MTEITKIKERIWKTKKARIAMETRVIKENKKINDIIFILSILLIILSLVNLLEPQLLVIFKDIIIEQKLIIISNIVSVIFSIILLCFSIKSDVKNQVNRVWMIRHCYTELAKLEFSDKDAKELNQDYQNILVRYENHETKDYIESIKDDKTEKIKFLINCLKGILLIVSLLIIIIIYLIIN